MAKATGKGKKPRGGSVQKWKKAVIDLPQDQQITKILALATTDGYSVDRAKVEEWLSQKSGKIPDALLAEMKAWLMKALSVKDVSITDVVSALKEANKPIAKSAKLFADMSDAEFEAMIAARKAIAAQK